MSAPNPLGISGPGWSGNYQQPNTALPAQPANEPAVSVGPFNVPAAAALVGETGNNFPNPPYEQPQTPTGVVTPNPAGTPTVINA